MDSVEIFVEFVRVFPEWQFWHFGGDTYVLSYHLVSGYDTYGFNPDNPQGKVINPGAEAPFCLSAISEVAFDGVALSFRSSGYTYLCHGLAGTISVRR